MTAESWMLHYQQGGLFFWSRSSLWALFMNDLISVYDQMSCKLLCTEKSRNVSLPRVPYMELLCLPGKLLESGKGGKRAAAKTHTKPTRSSIKRVRQRKQRKFWKTGCTSWVGPCIESSSLPKQQQLEQGARLPTGGCYRGNTLTMKNKSVPQYFLWSVGHKDYFWCMFLLACFILEGKHLMFWWADLKKFRESMLLSLFILLTQLLVL